MPSPFLGGLSSNPNASPMRPSYGMTPNPNQGVGTIREILAGLNTQQTNVPGMPTNTAPQQPGYGLGQLLRNAFSGGSNDGGYNRAHRNYGTPTQYADIQAMIDRGYDWQTIYNLTRQGGHGVGLDQYYAARTAGGAGQLTNPNQPGGANYTRPQVGLGEGQVAGWNQQGNHFATPRYGYGVSTGVPQPTPAATPAQPQGYRGGY
jgi:hypothetical protein